jgi:hypothetical protein
VVGFFDGEVAVEGSSEVLVGVVACVGGVGCE